MTAPLTPEQLVKLEKFLSKATPLPWFYSGYAGVFSSAKPGFGDDDCPCGCSEFAGTVAWVPAAHGDTASAPHRFDAELIEAAVNALPALLAAAREAAVLRAERDEARAVAVAFLNEADFTLTDTCAGTPIREAYPKACAWRDGGKDGG